jgi:uncharacterized protein (DUF2235 family)
MFLAHVTRSGHYAHRVRNLKGALGYGLEDNVLDAYTFLMNNYSPGDEIFIFGFSRGAFTARVLANFIARVGVFRKPQYTWELKRAWKAYREGAKGFQTYQTELQGRIDKWDKDDPAGPRARKVKVKVVGCWDTVASVGVPDYTSWLKWSEAYDYLDGSLVGGKLDFHMLGRNSDSRRHRARLPRSGAGRMPVSVHADSVVPS